jgi:hypothetical protein
VGLSAGHTTVVYAQTYSGFAVLAKSVNEEMTAGRTGC